MTHEFIKREQWESKINLSQKQRYSDDINTKNDTSSTKRQPWENDNNQNDLSK